MLDMFEKSNKLLARDCHKKSRTFMIQLYFWVTKNNLKSNFFFRIIQITPRTTNRISQTKMQATLGSLLTFTSLASIIVANGLDPLNNFCR